MITLKAISKNFGSNQVVKQISLTIAEGETLVLLGTSGSGKTTTLKMINRLIMPDSGSIHINGRDIKDDKPEIIRRKIGYVMQNVGLFPHYTVEENMAIVPKLLKWPAEKIKINIHELIEKLKLSVDCLKMFPHELSGGQQQRVGLARALVADPAILLMDEPFAALDNVTRSSIQAEFKGLEAFIRKTIVMVTHDVHEAFELADRICLMDRGEVVQIGTAKDLLYKPANEFAQKFLDGERLALEFKVVTIKDIWNFLPVSTSPSDKSFLSGLTSVWTAMEHLNINAHVGFVLDGANAPGKVINFSALTAAFHAYQNSSDHE